MRLVRLNVPAEYAEASGAQGSSNRTDELVCGHDELGELAAYSGGLDLEDCVFFFSSRRRHTRFDCDWSSDFRSAKIAAAKRDGSWTLLDSVEALEIPNDLRRALGAAGVRTFEALTPGRRKEHLRALVTAKRPETRAKRIADVVRLTRIG